MEKFTFINKDRSRIKVFEPFEDISKPSPSIDAMMISYGCVYKRSSKPVMKGSRVETVEAARKEYKKHLKARFCYSYTSVLGDNLRCSSGSVPKNLTMFWYNKKAQN